MLWLKADGEGKSHPKEHPNISKQELVALQHEVSGFLTALASEQTLSQRSHHPLKKRASGNVVSALFLLPVPQLCDLDVPSVRSSWLTGRLREGRSVPFPTTPCSVVAVSHTANIVQLLSFTSTLSSRSGYSFFVGECFIIWMRLIRQSGTKVSHLLSYHPRYTNLEMFYTRSVSKSVCSRVSAAL